MIKRIRFASRRDALTNFTTGWSAATGAALDAPLEVAPTRVVACTVLPEVTPDPRHDGIGIEWFGDSAHLARFESWLASPAGRHVDERLAHVIDLGSSPVLIAEEHVLRGPEWLEKRWHDGGEKLKHIAIAKRAHGLTPAQFSDLWKTRAGRVGSVAIPDVARGHAYVQNHVQASEGEDPAYDALNEVYFDDLVGVRARMNFFARTLEERNEDDLVSESWFVVAREELL